MRSFERIDQFAGANGASLMGWLARIAENEIRDQADFQRRGRRDAAADVPLDEAGAGPAWRGRSALSQAVAAQEAERLTDALESLDDDHREVIVLRKLEELSFKEVAVRMQRSEDACRMLLARAMVALTLTLRGVADECRRDSNAGSRSWVERHVRDGREPSLDDVCGDRPDLAPGASCR